MDGCLPGQKQYTVAERLTAITVAMRRDKNGAWATEIPKKVMAHLDALNYPRTPLSDKKVQDRLFQLIGTSEDPRVVGVAARTARAALMAPPEAALMAPPGARGGGQGSRDNGPPGHRLPSSAASFTGSIVPSSALIESRLKYSFEQLKSDVEAIFNSLKMKLCSDSFYGEIVLRAENFIHDLYGLKITDMSVMHVFNVLMERHLEHKPSQGGYGSYAESSYYRIHSFGVFDHAEQLIKFFEDLKKISHEQLALFFAKAIADGQKRFGVPAEGTDPVLQLGVVYFWLKCNYLERSSLLGLKDPSAIPVEFQTTKLESVGSSSFGGFSAKSSPESSKTVDPLILGSPESGLDALSAPSREMPAGIAPFSCGIRPQDQDDGLNRDIAKKRMGEIAQELESATLSEFEAYLQRVYTSGCKAVQFLAISTRNLVKYIPSFMMDVLEKHVVKIDVFKALQEDQFLWHEGHDLAETDPLFKKVLSSDLPQFLTAYQRFYLDRNRAEMNLFEKLLELHAIRDDLCQKLLESTDMILSKELDQKERQLAQFCFSKGWRALILNSRASVSKILDEIIDCLEQVIDWNKVRTYHICYAHDSESKLDISSLLREGIREMFIAYGEPKEAHLGRGCIMDARTSSLLESLLAKIYHREEVLSALKKLRFEINKLNGVIDKAYLRDFVILHDAIRFEWIIPDPETGQKVNALALREHLLRFSAGRLSSGVEAEGVGFYSSPELPAPVEKAIKVSSAKSESPVSGSSFSKIFMKKFPVSRCRPAAKQAYINAIHYAEVLYDLLLNQGACLDAKSVAQLQMDVGFAANLALEQIITALVIHYDLAIQRSRYPVGSLYEKCGHSLTRRLEHLNFKLSDPLDHVLKKAEHLELKIRDLYGKGKNPSLLENTAGLLRGASRVSFEDERVKCCAEGNEFVELLIVLHSALYFYQEKPPGFERHLEEIGHKGSGGSRSPYLENSLPIDTSKMLEYYNFINNVVSEALSGDLEKLTPIEDNLFSLNSCLTFISKFSNNSLFNFYLSRSRYILCIILEKFILAARERVGIPQSKDISHNLIDLIPLKHADLNNEQKNYLQDMPKIRFETRYKTRVTSTMPTSFADFELTEEEVELEDLAEPDGRLGDIFGFTPNLSARDSKAMDKLKCEIGIAASLCGLIAEKCFPSKLVVHN